MIATMRPTSRNSAKNPSARTHSAEMSRLLTTLHQAISDIIIDPLDTSSYAKADDTCQAIWQWCTSFGITPWSYCLDRYCSCKVMLSEWEPDQLPGVELEARRPTPVRQGRRTGAGS